MSDEFGSNIEERKERGASKFRKTEFLKLDEGEKIIRILDGREVRHYTHYLGWVYVKCLEDECPICQNNKKILYEHPEDYRDVKGWNPRKSRYYINVLDRSKVKVCSKCQTEATANLEVCPACGTVLGEAKPLDAVRVLTGGSKLFEDLKVLSNTVRNDDDERIDIRTYDWLMVTRGKKLDKVTNPSPRYNPAKAGLLELNESQVLFDLDNTVVTLAPDEMLDVWNGTSLKDIFAVRRAKKESLSAELETPNAQLEADMEDAVGSIFKS